MSGNEVVEAHFSAVKYLKIFFYVSGFEFEFELKMASG